MALASASEAVLAFTTDEANNGTAVAGFAGSMLQAFHCGGVVPFLETILWLLLVQLLRPLLLPLL